MRKYHILELPQQRRDQPSFHVASEKHVRIEFMRLGADQTLGPVQHGGDVVVTCVAGAVFVGDETLEVLEQCVVVEGSELKVVGRADASTIQLMWCPTIGM